MDTEGNSELDKIEQIILCMHQFQIKLEKYAFEKGWISHCFDCEESLSSRGLAKYEHTCRCYCEVCLP